MIKVESIQVNEQHLNIKEHDGQRVVTMWDIAKLHGTNVRNIRMNFKNNQKHLVEGEDYFLLDKVSDFAVNLIYNNDVSKQAINRVKDIPAFTEAGYLLMTKPMTGEISWKVQRQLINCYFKVKEQVLERNQVVKKEAPQYMLDELNKTLEIMTAMYRDIKASTEDTFAMSSSLFEKVGIELPALTNKSMDKTF